MGTYTTLEFTAQLNDRGVAVVNQFAQLMAARVVCEGKESACDAWWDGDDPMVGTVNPR